MSQQCTSSCHPRAWGQLVPGKCLACLRIRSAGCGTVVFLLLLSDPLMGKAGLEACSGFLVGGTGVCPLVGGAGSWSSGGQGHV